ncbi:MAG TPA: hypothetical protein VFM34_01195, partial [Moraxellaceae bacterium]|nr:hypothetical protein [Moraxellaceae bacterium]
VRIPNEQLIKSEVVNLTRFAIRKLNLALGVAYKEDIQRVRALLLGVALDNPLVLDEPAPQVILQELGASAINLQFSVWTRRENYASMRDQLQESIKEAFDRESVEIPFPQVAISNSGDSFAINAATALPAAGAATEPSEKHSATPP